MGIAKLSVEAGWGAPAKVTTEEAAEEIKSRSSAEAAD